MIDRLDDVFNRIPNAIVWATLFLQLNFIRRHSLFLCANPQPHAVAPRSLSLDKDSVIRKLAEVTLIIIIGLAGGVAYCDEISVQTNIYNVHYHPDSEHIPYSPLVGMEYRWNCGWLVGGALFLNSFGQFSQTAYVGYLWNLGNTPFYTKIVGGIIHGYAGENKGKLPVTVGNFAPGAFPSIGVRYKDLRIETQLFWSNGMMVAAGIVF